MGTRTKKKITLRIIGVTIEPNKCAKDIHPLSIILLAVLEITPIIPTANEVIKAHLQEKMMNMAKNPTVITNTVDFDLSFFITIA